MAYQIERSDASPRKAMRRIAAEQLRGAVTVLGAGGTPPPPAIHDLRKRIKKTRGLLRLVAPQMPTFRAENTALRDGARAISGLRDAAVRRATLAALLDHMPADQRAAVRPLNALLHDAPEEHPERAAAALARLERELAAVAGRAPHWKIAGRGFEVLAPGLSLTWTQSRKWMARAARALERDMDAEPFHEWSKHVKAHWYQARILEPIWPELMGPHIFAADTLGELLGDHNDIDVLMVHLRDAGAARVAPEGLAALEPVARARRHDHAVAALALGQKLFAGEGRDLAARWGVWWKVWRNR